MLHILKKTTITADVDTTKWQWVVSVWNLDLVLSEQFSVYYTGSREWRQGVISDTDIDI